MIYLNEISYVHLIYIGLIGLCVGSFLNVLIARIPNNLPLLNARSHCPYCKRILRWQDNIPILSYVALKGQCHFCQCRISPQYPFVEIITCLLSVLIVLRFGISFESSAALIFTWSLIALAFIDFKTLLLPDSITVPLLWLGLFFNLFYLFTTPSHAMMGAMLGYLSLWSVYWLFKIITHKEGMGYGDFKLLAMIGAWLGWQALPFILLFSSLTATIFAVSLILMKKQDKNMAIPFGFFLAMGGWLALMFQHKIRHWYFGNLWS